MHRPSFAAWTLAASLLSSGCGDDSSSAEDGADGSGADSGMNEETEAPADESTGGGGEGSHADGILAGMWADDITISVEGDAIAFTSDGVPEHDVLEAYGLMDGTTTPVSSSTTNISVPAEPQWSDTTTDTSGGAIGIAISGAVYFNPYEGDGTTVAVDNNFDVGGVPFLDSCNGHPLPDGGTYHYHGVPYCITDVVDASGEHSALIGVLLDGYPVYGPWGEGGAAPGDLDECSGHEGATPEFPGGVYHYHLTETAPYSIPCYHGVVEGGGMMPPMGAGE